MIKIYFDWNVLSQIKKELAQKQFFICSGEEYGS